jgi:hypothetical protein
MRALKKYRTVKSRKIGLILYPHFLSHRIWNKEIFFPQEISINDIIFILLAREELENHRLVINYLQKTLTIYVLFFANSNLLDL